MNTGWQDDRLMQAYDLLWQVMQDRRSQSDSWRTLHMARDAIERADDEIKDENHE